MINVVAFAVWHWYLQHRKRERDEAVNARVRKTEISMLHILALRFSFVIRQQRFWHVDWELLIHDGDELLSYEASLIWLKSWKIFFMRRDKLVCDNDGDLLFRKYCWKMKDRKSVYTHTKTWTLDNGFIHEDETSATESLSLASVLSGRKQRVVLHLREPFSARPNDVFTIKRMHPLRKLERHYASTKIRDDKRCFVPTC